MLPRRSCLVAPLGSRAAWRPLHGNRGFQPLEGAGLGGPLGGSCGEAAHWGCEPLGRKHQLPMVPLGLRGQLSLCSSFTPVLSPMHPAWPILLCSCAASFPAPQPERLPRVAPLCLPAGTPRQLVLHRRDSAPAATASNRLALRYLKSWGAGQRTVPLQLKAPWGVCAGSDSTAGRNTSSRAQNHHRTVHAPQGC